MRCSDKSGGASISYIMEKDKRRYLDNHWLTSVSSSSSTPFWCDNSYLLHFVICVVKMLKGLSMWDMHVPHTFFSDVFDQFCLSCWVTHSYQVYLDESGIRCQLVGKYFKYQMHWSFISFYPIIRIPIVFIICSNVSYISFAFPCLRWIFDCHFRLPWYVLPSAALT